MHVPQITSIQDAISTYNSNVTRIADLHNRTLNSTDENANQQNAAMLEDLISQTRDLGNSIKSRLQSLEAQPAQPGQDMRIRKNRVSIFVLASRSELSRSQLCFLDRFRALKVR
jgi:syntaxin 1B/2/3